MSLITLRKPVSSGVFDSATYSGSNDVTVNYRTDAKVSLGVSTKTLRMRIAWPTQADPTQPRPLFLYCHMGGWTTSNIDDLSADTIQWPVKMGCIAAAIEVRIASDDPIDTATNAGMNVQSRATYAAAADLDMAHQFILGNYRKTANFSIEPNWVFTSGSSCGGITTLICPQIHLGRPLAGIITAASAFGALGSGLTDGDTYIRSTLGITEAGLTTPCCAFYNEDDTRITATRLDAFGTKANTIDGSVVTTNATGGHVGLFGWSNTTIATFIASRCAATTPAICGLLHA